MNKIENKKYLNIGFETNLLLSENIKISYNTRKTHLGCMNVLVIGATGEGKSYRYIKPVSYSLLKDPKTGRKMSFVYNDPKGELYEDLAGFFEANGYQIGVLNLIDMLHSDCYNPFRYFNYSKNPDITLMNYINSLVEASAGKEGSQGDNAYWYNMAKNLINSLAYYCYYELPAEYQNFSTISDMVPLFFKGEKDKEAPIDKLYKSCKQISINKHPAIKWRNKIKNAQGKELGSILGTTNDALRLWADSNVRRITQFDTIRLDEVGDRPTALFVITPPDNSTYDFLVGTFYDQLISTLLYKANFIYKKKGLPHQVILMREEAANAGKINDYNKKIAVWRSANIASIDIVQSTSQEKAMFGDKAQDVIDNQHITIFLGNGGNSIDTSGSSAAEFMSRALGKTTVKAESYSLNYNQNDIRPVINSSINLSQRDLMTPDEVKRLGWDECIVMIKGYKPFKDKKINMNKCLNYASELYSTQDKNGNWSLKKEFIYDIEEKLQTIDSYNKGYEECKYIDKIQNTAVKKRLVVDSQFSSFKTIKKRNLIYINNDNYIGIDNITDYIRQNGKNLIVENLLEKLRNSSNEIGFFMRESILPKKDNISKNDTDISENSQLAEEKEDYLTLDEKKQMIKFTDESKKAEKEFLKTGSNKKCKEMLNKFAC